MNCKKTMTWLGVAIALPIFAACSSNEPKRDDVQQNKEATAASSTAAVPPAAAQAAAPKPAVEVKNPTVISFEKMAVSLDSQAREQLAQIVDRAKQAKKILITGYCDKRQVGNPTDAAIARAVVARDELIRYGVMPANIQIKFATNVPHKHAAEIKFD